MRNPASCGTWTRYDARVEVEGQTAALPHGGSVDVGGLRWFHGGDAVPERKRLLPPTCRSFGEGSAVAVEAVRLGAMP